MAQSSSHENAAAKVQERLKIITNLVHDIEHERGKGEQTLDTISKVQKKINEEKKCTSQSQQKLKELYTAALNEALQEEELLRQALANINDIRVICNQQRIQARNGGHRETFHRGALMKMLQESAQTLPLWTGRHDEKAPPLCGAIPPEPNYIAQPGEMVAALVKNVEGHEDRWILAEVVSFNPTTKKYEVDDIDEEQKLKHTLSRRQVIPLPQMRANPETEPYAFFQKGAVVMALYPQTTCFYKAIINRMPKSVLDEYELVFEDNSYPSGYAPPLKVPQRYVIDIKEKKKA